MMCSCISYRIYDLQAAIGHCAVDAEDPISCWNDNISYCVKHIHAFREHTWICGNRESNVNIHTQLKLSRFMPFQLTNLWVEVKCAKDKVVAIEAKSVNARDLAVTVIVPQHQYEQRCTAQREQTAQAVPNLQVKTMQT